MIRAPMTSPTGAQVGYLDDDEIQVLVYECQQRISKARAQNPSQARNLLWSRMWFAGDYLQISRASPGEPGAAKCSGQLLEGLGSIDAHSSGPSCYLGVKVLEAGQEHLPTMR